MSTPWKPLSIDISIHVPRVEDDSAHRVRTCRSRISIHVPRVEDDDAEGIKGIIDTAISIHVPRVEDDIMPI